LQQIYEDVLILHSMPCFYFSIKKMDLLVKASATKLPGVL